MPVLYLVTGAAGHLGGAIVRLLQREGKRVRGLILPGERAPQGCACTVGDVRDVRSLRALFENAQGCELIVLHTAAIVDIAAHAPKAMYDVNVGGVKNMLALSSEYAVRRFVYVSSVHAIPEVCPPAAIRESAHFSPELVHGAYARTKAEASQAVLDAAAQGLDAVIVHPSGILGPYCAGGNHLVQMIEDYAQRKLPAAVAGGYDFVDVRDAAWGVVAAADSGRRGECYILSNRRYEIRDVLAMAARFCGGRRLPVLPLWSARAAAPLFALAARARRERPLYTPYSLETLGSGVRFDHSKATRELGYHPRGLLCTVRDTLAWYAAKKRSAIPGMPG